MCSKASNARLVNLAEVSVRPPHSRWPLAGVRHAVVDGVVLVDAGALYDSDFLACCRNPHRYPGDSVACSTSIANLLRFLRPPSSSMQASAQFRWCSPAPPIHRSVHNGLGLPAIQSSAPRPRTSSNRHYSRRAPTRLTTSRRASERAPSLHRNGLPITQRHAVRRPTLCRLNSRRMRLRHASSKIVGPPWRSRCVQDGMSHATEAQHCSQDSHPETRGQLELDEGISPIIQHTPGMSTDVLSPRRDCKNVCPKEFRSSFLWATVCLGGNSECIVLHHECRDPAGAGPDRSLATTWPSRLLGTERLATGLGDHSFWLPGRETCDNIPVGYVCPFVH